MSDMTMRDRAAVRRESRRFGVATLAVRRSTDTTEVDISGYASVTGQPYPVRDILGEYQETIEGGAFKKTLADADDVRMLFNHGGMPLARSKAGTLTLAEDKTGLKVDATLDTRSAVSNSLVVALERGDVDEMSFAFKVTRQEWNDDYSERWIHECRLFDVSAVTYPANPATTIKLRAADFLMNNLSADEADEFVRRYTDHLDYGDDSGETLAMPVIRLKQRRAQLAGVVLRVVH